MPAPHLEFEIQAGYPHLTVAGIDEVGRGCLAGPVVAAALILPAQVDLSETASQKWLKKINDSKLTTPQIRSELEPLIQNWALSWAIGVASVEEIDQINIYHASHLAMTRAVEKLLANPEFVLVDGNVIPKGILARKLRARSVIKGDQQSLSIAAASILAKVYRDRLMSELDTQHPGYGFVTHKGYGTPAHQRALDNLGPCPIHRRSFAPVAKRIAASQLSF